MNIQNIKAILFDFDGVLVKTMESHFNAWKKTLKAFNIHLKEEEYYPLEGMKLIKIAEYLCQKNNKHDVCYEDIVKEKIKNYTQDTRCELYPGVTEFIEILNKKAIKKAIVSASVYEQLLKGVGPKFLEQFDAIIEGNSTALGKPSPDPYLEGARKLGLEPGECIVIENAPLGIESAKKAGMYCIAISSTVDKNKLSKADEVIGSFNDLCRIFEPC